MITFSKTLPKTNYAGKTKVEASYLQVIQKNLFPAVFFNMI